LGDDAGGGEGDEVGGDDHAGVAFGAALGMSGVTFEDADLVSGLGEVVGGGEADDSTADDEDFLGFRHWKVLVRPSR